MADQIYQLLTDVQMRHRITEQGLEYSQQFTWEKSVQQTIEVYESAVSP